MVSSLLLGSKLKTFGVNKSKSAIFGSFKNREKLQAGSAPKRSTYRGRLSRVPKPNTAVSGAGDYFRRSVSYVSPNRIKSVYDFAVGLYLENLLLALDIVYLQIPVEIAHCEVLVWR